MSQQSQQQRFEMPSGATLVITIAPFQDAWSLMKASLKTIKGASFTQDDLKLELGNLANSPAAISMILDRIIDFSSSPEVEAAIWKCAQRALYIPAGSDLAFPGTKVDPFMFDDPNYGIKAREDLPQIISKLLEVNCKPFLAQALSGFLKPLTTPSESLPLKSA